MNIGLDNRPRRSTSEGRPAGRAGGAAALNVVREAVVIVIETTVLLALAATLGTPSARPRPSSAEAADLPETSARLEASRGSRPAPQLTAASWFGLNDRF